MAEPDLIELQLPRVRMSALTWGPQDGRLALCVHGFPDSAHTWRFIAPMLADRGFRVVAPFTRGYAPTGPAPDGDYHIGALMTDLIDLHTQLDGGDDAVLIGHDWGAWTTNALAAYAGAPFGSYVSLALPPVASIQTGRGVGRKIRMSARQLRNSWYVLFFQFPWLPERMLASIIPRLWKDWSPRGAQVGDDVHRTLAALPTVAHRKAAIGYYRAAARVSGVAPHYAGLQRFWRKVPRIPMLVLHGQQDGAMQIGYLDGTLDALPPGSRLVRIPDAGHFLQIDQPDAVFTAIAEYLKVN